MAAVTPWRPTKGDRAIYRAGFGGAYDLFSVTATFSDVNRTITRASGDWLADGVEPGDRIRVLNTMYNDRVVTVDTVTATVITVPPSESLTSEASVVARFSSVEEFEGVVCNGPRGTMRATATGSIDDEVIYGPAKPGQISGNDDVPVQWDRTPPLTGADSTCTARPAGPSERARQTRQTREYVDLRPQGDYSYLTGPKTITLTSGVQNGEWEQIITRVENVTALEIEVTHRTGSDVRVIFSEILSDGSPAEFFNQLVADAPSPTWKQLTAPISGADGDNPAATRRFAVTLINGAGGGATPWLVRNLAVVGS